MHEQALAQVQPALSFSSCNPRIKISAWLQLGRCHGRAARIDFAQLLAVFCSVAASGQKHHAAAVIDDALKEAQRTKLLFHEY